MYRRLSIVSIIALLLALALAGVASAQTGTGNQGTQGNQGNQGGDPGSAFNSLSQSSRNLNAGQRQWYVFRYAGDNSPIQVRLAGSNATFSIWTQQDIQNAKNDFSGATANPVGRSSANNQFGGDQYWTGSFNAPGNYYILVETTNGGANTGNYTLNVTGTGVSWQGQAGANTGSTGNQAGANTGSTCNQAGANTGSTGNQSGANTGSTGNQSGANTGSTGSNQQGGLAPSTLPTTGGEAASAFPMVIGALGALSVAAGALLRRKK